MAIFSRMEKYLSRAGSATSLTSASLSQSNLFQNNFLKRERERERCYAIKLSKCFGESKNHIKFQWYLKFRSLFAGWLQHGAYLKYNFIVHPSLGLLCVVALTSFQMIILLTEFRFSQIKGHVQLPPFKTCMFFFLPPGAFLFFSPPGANPINTTIADAISPV